MEPEPSNTEASLHEVTALLHDLQAGRSEALDQLIPLVYEELRVLAHDRLRYERTGHTLNTTALVHEAYFRLADQRWAFVQNRSHFLAVAARTMRRILVSYARRQQAAKRGGRDRPASFDEALPDNLESFSATQGHDLLALDAALTRLEAFNERGCRVVEYRFFGGMTYEEIADLMGLSVPTVRRSWALARMWLRKEMMREES